MLIISADWHLRRSRPKSRIDDFFISQEKKVRFIFELAKDLNCPLIIAGDLFEKPRPGEFVKQWLINLIVEYNVKILCVAGQHDIPNHNLALLPDSGIGVLEAAGVITLMTDPNNPQVFGDYVIYGCAFGMTPAGIVTNKDKKNILIWHHMVIDEPLWEDQVADKAGKILRLNPQFDLIVTGDNHTTFIYDRKGKWLVNPGSLMRKEADQVDHLPSVFIYNDGKVDRVFLPIEEDVFNVSHIAEAKEKGERYGQFIDKLHKGYEIGVDLNANFVSFFNENKIRKPVENLVWECISDDK